MEWRVLIVLGIAWQLDISSSSTMKQMVDTREDLKQITNLIEGLSLFSVDMNTNRALERYTVFLPLNSAFNSTYLQTKVFNYLKRESISSIRALERILNYNTLFNQEGKTYTTTDLAKLDELESLELQTFLFFHRIPGVGDFINGARIVVPNLQASNGMLHIVDRYLWDVGRDGRTPKYLELEQQRDDSIKGIFITPEVSKFKELLDEYVLVSNTLANAAWKLGTENKITLFLPHNSAFESLGSVYMQRLKGDGPQLKKVVESHVIVGQVLHSRVLDYMSEENIAAEENYITPRTFKGHYYVSNNCAQGKIIRPDITMANGVIHIIDGLLGYVYLDIYSYARDNSNDLSRLFTHLFATPTLDEKLKMDDGAQEADVDAIYTVFAPIDSVWGGKVFTQDVPKLIQVMEMHVVKGRVSAADMVRGFSKPTMRDGYPMTFEQDGDDIIVSVNFIRAKIVEANICVKNGIIHKIDNVLGVAVDNMWDYIHDRDDLQETYIYMRNLGLDAWPKNPNRRITLFAPTNDAFHAMEDTQRGKNILDSRNRHILANVMNRHIVSEMVTLRTMGQSLDVDSVFDGFTVERDGEGYIIYFGPFDIHVIEPDLKMANGIIHIIGHVIYSDDPQADARTGSGATWYGVSVTLILLITVHVGILLRERAHV